MWPPGRRKKRNNAKKLMKKMMEQMPNHERIVGEQDVALGPSLQFHIPGALESFDISLWLFFGGGGGLLPRTRTAQGWRLYY